MNASPSYEEIARSIDHALLAPALTSVELEAGVALARAYGVASACVVPHFLGRCAELLAGSGVRASTTIGFPHGGHVTDIKLAEARRALEDGGEELDAVVNVSDVRSGAWTRVRAELEALTSLVHARGARIKVIFEIAYLDDAQKVRLCELCGALGVDWVKTSTGFAPSGATPVDVALLRRHTPIGVEVKASGGVRNLDQLLALRAAGASRIGTSRTREILDEHRRRLGLPPIASPAGPTPDGY